MAIKRKDESNQDEKFLKVAEIETPEKREASRSSQGRSDAATSGDTSTASTTTSTREEAPNKGAETSGAGDGIGELPVAAERVQGEEIPLKNDELDARPDPAKEDEQRQVLVIPDDPNLYPVIRTVNDPADQQSYQDAEQQRIMEARRQADYANRGQDTPVTEREMRRRMSQQG